MTRKFALLQTRKVEQKANPITFYLLAFFQHQGTKVTYYKNSLVKNKSLYKRGILTKQIKKEKNVST